MNININKKSQKCILAQRRREDNHPLQKDIERFVFPWSGMNVLTTWRHVWFKGRRYANPFPSPVAKQNPQTYKGPLENFVLPKKPADDMARKKVKEELSNMKDTL